MMKPTVAEHIPSCNCPRLLAPEPIRIIGYPVSLVLAEKIVTAMQRGTANTRWRDLVDMRALLKTNPPDPDELPHRNHPLAPTNALQPSAHSPRASTATRRLHSHGGLRGVVIAETAAGLDIVDELLHSDEEGRVLARSESFEVRPEPGKPTVGGHAVQRFRRGLTGFAADRRPAINASP